MTSHRIEYDTFSINVHGPRTTELDNLTNRYGRYNKRTGTYEFPKSVEAEIRAAVDSTIPANNDTAHDAGRSTSTNRQASGRRSHPLGGAVEAGDGYTVYQDTAFGGGRVQIWDES